MAETNIIDETKARRLQVASLPPADSGRGVARLPEAVMTGLGLKDGDVVEIIGQRTTAARAIGLLLGLQEQLEDLRLEVALDAVAVVRDAGHDLLAIDADV